MSHHQREELPLDAETIDCSVCGMPFVPKSPETRECSNACRGAIGASKRDYKAGRGRGPWRQNAGPLGSFGAVRRLKKVKR